MCPQSKNTNPAAVVTESRLRDARGLRASRTSNFNPHGTMIGAADLGADEGPFKARAQGDGDEEVIDAPSDIPGAGVGHRTPPSVMAVRRRRRFERQNWNVNFPACCVRMDPRWPLASNEPDRDQPSADNFARRRGVSATPFVSLRGGKSALGDGVRYSVLAFAVVCAGRRIIGSGRFQFPDSAAAFGSVLRVPWPGRESTR